MWSRAAPVLLGLLGVAVLALAVWTLVEGETRAGRGGLLVAVVLFAIALQLLLQRCPAPQRPQPSRRSRSRLRRQA